MLNFTLGNSINPPPRPRSGKKLTILINRCGKEGTKDFRTKGVISVASQRPDSLGDIAGYCYGSLGMLTVNSKNQKSLPTAHKNWEENLVELERLILCKCHFLILSQP